jgi:23S rRNA pseudouridine1911/1915/1917 synthase
VSLLLGKSARWSAWNKPAGIPVFPPHADPEGDCLLMRTGLDVVGWDPKFSGGLAHRLDTPTSGQVLSAHTSEDLVWLRALFSGGGLEKVYHFVSAGEVPWDTNTVDAPIAHDKRKRTKMIVSRGQQTPHRGKWYPARTEFERVGPTTDGAQLWCAVIRTGVMHQIRAHAAFVGIPIRGDRRYGGGAPQDERVPFLLHHLGLSGPGLSPPRAPIPDFWPIIE